MSEIAGSGWPKEGDNLKFEPCILSFLAWYAKAIKLYKHPLIALQSFRWKLYEHYSFLTWGRMKNIWINKLFGLGPRNLILFFAR